jgi:hypothetical protein
VAPHQTAHQHRNILTNVITVQTVQPCLPTTLMYTGGMAPLILNLHSMLMYSVSFTLQTFIQHLSASHHKARQCHTAPVRISQGMVAPLSTCLHLTTRHGGATQCLSESRNKAWWRHSAPVCISQQRMVAALRACLHLTTRHSGATQRLCISPQRTVARHPAPVCISPQRTVVPHNISPQSTVAAQSTVCSP